MSINNYIHKINGLEQYQVVQKGDGYYKIIVKIRDKSFSKNECIKKMHECFGKNAKIEIEIVDNIELQKNGKFKMTIKDF